MFLASMEILENLAKANPANLDCFNAQDCIRIKIMEGIEENVCADPSAICLQVKTLMLR